MRTLYFIPARSGSKGIKDKNIKLINNKPLLSYVISAIRNTNNFNSSKDIIFLNTDSERYAEIGKEYGAETPYLRQKELATDSSVITDVIINMMNYYKNKNIEFDYLAFIQPTSPLITSEDIDKGFEELEENPSIDAINSVTEADTIPLWCNTLDENLSMDNFIDEEIKKKNRQELPQYYQITGAIRIARYQKIIMNKFDWYKNSKALILDKLHSVDIDTIEDFMYAEYLIKRRDNV
ncbi:acylneuraminate cytidylyltransferase family protein [Anaerosporobacter faecicola]|uniref:acylneuraminate cytidylyltransferase family protein n=1 Tax=Anaerosporobacter faecicola TaxID=2718714 RepID=UPI00143BDFCD|nr:acylneuraminate cytidylyltransferase family protein [Anaerosporobacter faecicola]